MPEKPDPIDVAARALRHRDRSRRQIEERLERAGVVSEDERADALEALERVGYVDDARFAATRAASLAERGYGDAAVRQLLAADGVPNEAVEAAVSGLEPERDRAVRLVARLGASAQTAARLQRKGFAEDTLESALGDGFAEGGREA
ncbi:MAG: regulatory protein RecX [Gaiellaceae bacterium]